MSLVFPKVTRFGTALALVLAVIGSSNVEGESDADTARPPLEIRFRSEQGGLRAKKDDASCGLPPTRDRVYDPETGVFHIHFKARDFSESGFEVAKTADRITKPVVFRLTGVPRAYGCLGHPLTLSVGGKTYGLDPSCASLYSRDERQFDKGLFQSERKGDVLTVQFTEKGQALLKAGAQITLAIDTGW